ncbi:hypothetical protein [Chryseobacterium indologenes]|uniref:hypothetical protein n=1 Tax=Chryseobacterium indologenes TaxID=253 RepID=UPI001C08EF9B|nr:hypothetical protein [Chryseobacterium indologenes]MBU3046797.1 hypothetical protein [Chryseobacterium indologenes]
MLKTQLAVFLRTPIRWRIIDNHCNGYQLSAFKTALHNSLSSKESLSVSSYSQSNG